MDLIDHLQTLAARAKQTGTSLTNEEATKMALVAPFLQALGYDIFNPMEVKPEFAADLPGIKQGERVDYAVLENGVRGSGFSGPGPSLTSEAGHCPDPGFPTHDQAQNPQSRVQGPCGHGGHFWPQDPSGDRG